MSQQGSLPSSDPLAEFLSGKRQHQRHDVTLQVEIVGKQARLFGEAVDVSEGGARIGVKADDLEAIGNGDVLAVMSNEFSDGFDVHFVGAKIVVEAEVIRLTGDTETLYLGARWFHPLSANQQKALAFERVPAVDEALELSHAPFTELPLEPRADLPPCLLIFDDRPNTQGPRYVAHVTGLGGCTMSARIDGANPNEVSTALGAQGFRFRFLTGNADWDSNAELIAARFVDAPGGGAAEIALLAKNAPNRRVKRAFRHRKS